jgi:hypothetical protein
VAAGLDFAAGPSTDTRSRYRRRSRPAFGVSRKSFAARWEILTVPLATSFRPSRRLSAHVGVGHAFPSG